MTELEIYKQLVQKQDELVVLLDEMNFDTNPEKSQWKERRRLFKELAVLKRQLEKCGKDKYCTCGNPSKQGDVHFEGDEELIYICSDCGKQSNK